MADSRRLAALFAYDFHVGNVDGALFLDDPARLVGTAGLLVLGLDVHALDADLPRLGEGREDFALLALILARNDEYGVVYFYFHSRLLLTVLRARGR